MFTTSTFLISVLIGSFMHHRLTKYAAIPLIIFIMLTNLAFIRTDNRIYETDNYFESNDATTTSADELRPIWVKDLPGNRRDDRLQLPRSTTAQIKIDKSNYLAATLQAIDTTQVVVNTIYFPNWQGYIDNQKVTTKPNAQGLITLEMPAGTHELELKFERTPIRAIADGITLLSLVGLISIGLWSKQLSRSR